MTTDKIKRTTGEKRPNTQQYVAPPAELRIALHLAKPVNSMAAIVSAPNLELCPTPLHYMRIGIRFVLLVELFLVGLINFDDAGFVV